MDASFARLAALALLVFSGVLAGDVRAGDAEDEIFRDGFDVVNLPAGSIAFSDETSQYLDQIADSDYRFDALWTDFNGDGCHDAWIFAHADPATSRLWVNDCSAAHQLVLTGNDLVHYYINPPELPRGSGWISLLDFNGDGRQDFWTRDAATPAARYVNATSAPAATPFFSGKETGCDDHCVQVDIDGDDRFDVVREDGTIRDALDGSSVAATIDSANYRGAADIDGDGWTDLVQPLGGGYWHNDQGVMEWRAVPGLTGDTELMLMVDFDNDGDIDLFTIGQTQNGARLYRNDANASFTDASSGSGVEAIQFQPWWTGYGNVTAGDLDNDGLQDIVVAGDRYSPSVSLLRNLGGLHFERLDLDLGDSTAGSESGKPRASLADFDNDGRLDLLKTQAGTNAGIWRNTTATGSNRWMKLRVRGQGLNSDGVGADVKWYAPGTNTLLAHMSVQVSNQHPQTWLHTGVGAHAKVDMLISWPHGGPTRRFDNLDTDQEIIAWPASGGCIIEHWSPGSGWPLAAPANCQ